MKKLLFIFLIFFAMKAKSQNEDALIKEFVNSTDFEWVTKYSSLGGLWKPDLTKSFVSYENVDGKMVPILTVVLISLEASDEGKYIGQVQAVKVKSSYKQLPRKAGYLMLFRDFSAFSVDNQSGVIRIYDLNYDSWLALEASIESGNVIGIESHDMPSETIAKYNYGDYGKSAPDIHFCDKNHNGDVSWGECFLCLVSSCQRNWTCQILCNILNLKSGLCFTSMALACVSIAIQY